MSQPGEKTERKIRLLAEEVYNRIAAGEVVERPASVLKELIENALDAGADQIDVTIAGAGHTEITVSDNGSGMLKADLLLAFEQHATSKVSTVQDLNAISTLGFRGEALSAIASVSRVEAVSRTPSSLSGYRLKLHGGRIQDVVEDGAPEGTSISVRDIFYNTPARKKFLKSKGVEGSHLVGVFKKYALAYPQVRWSLNIDGKNQYRLPAEDLQSRIQALFTDDLADSLFPVSTENENFKLTGYLGSPNLARRTRGDQHLFVNRRWVQNRLLGHAVASAFGSLIEERKFPFYVLFIDTDAAEVDVNVHPAKSEVKFRRENDAYSFVQNSVRQTLQQAGMSAVRDMTLRQGEHLDQLTGEIRSPAGAQDQSDDESPRGGYQSPSSSQVPRRPFAPKAYQLAFAPLQAQNEGESSQSEPEQPAERTQVYQFHNRYIVTEVKSGIAIIDQHAAHERILYEKALRALAGSGMHGQQLLFPKIIELEAATSERLREVLPDFQSLGITIREFGERSFVLEALPSGISAGDDDQIVLEILEELDQRGVARHPGHDQIAAAFACRAAIKFGKSLTLNEMNSLIDQLFASRFPFTCPHGRPTLLNLSLGELERRFGRA